MLSRGNGIELKDVDLILYHGKCPDGICGAWSVWSVYKESKNTFIGVQHGGTVPDVSNKNVLMIDFSYPKDVIESMLDSSSGKNAKHIFVLDHHKSSLDLVDIQHPNFSYVLDMSRSGAQLAYDYVHNKLSENTVDSDRPWFVNDIADRDLWNWKLPNSNYTTRAMFGLGFYESIEKFDEKLNTYSREYLTNIGEIFVNEDKEIYKSICKRAVYANLTIPSNPDNEERKFLVRIVGCDHSHTSNVGNLLCEEKNSEGKYLCDFSVMWRYEFSTDEWYISMRGAKESDIDLSSIARKFYKGGGHPKASGFTLKGAASLRNTFVPNT